METQQPGKVGRNRQIIAMVAMLLTVTVFGLFLSGKVRALEVYSGSMSPTVAIGDRVLAMSSRDKELEVGTMVVITSPDDDGPDLLKRIVAVPGDEVEIINGLFYRNGKLSPPPGGLKDWHPRTRYLKETLGPDRYFVLGDARAKSHDSEEFGSIPRSSILDVVFYRYYPLTRAGGL